MTTMFWLLTDQEKSLSAITEYTARVQRLQKEFSVAAIFGPEKVKTGTWLTTLLGIWRCRASARTDWPGVQILWDGKLDLHLLVQCDSTYN